MKAALLLLALATAASAQTVPPLSGRVVDTADMLSPATEAAVTRRLAAVEDSTSAQIVVLTVPSLDGGDLEAFATTVFRTWRLGQADRDNGVLLLVVRDDRVLRIEVGYGLEGDLTDARASEIIRDVIVPRLRDGDPDAGISAGVDAIVASIDRTFEPSAFRVQAPPPSTDWSRFLIPLAMFGGMGLLILVVLMLIMKPRAVLATVQRAVVTVVSMAVAISLVGLLRVFWPLVLLFVAFFVVSIPFWARGVAMAERLPVVGPRVTALRRLAAIRGIRRRRLSEAFRGARRRRETRVVVEDVEYEVPSLSESSGSSGSGSSSSSSSGSSFSGGGGSSGGGGASGSW